MTDTTNKALDALQERIAMKAAMIQMGEKIKWGSDAEALNDANAAITALRVERDQWASMVGHIVACLPLKDIVPASATMGELIDAIKGGLAERDALRAQLAVYEAAGIVEIAARNPSVMDYMKHWEGRAERAEAQLATARADALREAAKLVRTMPMRFAGCTEDYVRDALSCGILAMIDTPTPSAPSPEAVARAALKDGAEVLHEFADAALTAQAEEHALQMAEKLEEMADHPDTIAAIVAKAGGGE